MNIDKKNRSQLKGYFVKNSIPTEQQFADLIDGMLNQKDDGIVKPSDATPLSIQAVTVPLTGQKKGIDFKKVIDFYENFQDPNPAWTFMLNPVIDGTAKSGFCISDGSVSRLFIDKITGKVSVGSLSVQGAITPSAGNGDNGIVFPRPASDGGGDSAWVKYYSRVAGGELMTLEIGVSNDREDHIALMPSGNVGIGTNQPQHKFQIGDDVNGLGFDIGGSPNAGIFRFGDNTGWKLHFGRSRESSGGTLNTGVSGVLMTITDDGNVGIGTKDPQKKLHVIGSSQIVGETRLKGTVMVSGNMLCNVTNPLADTNYKIELIGSAFDSSEDDITSLKINDTPITMTSARGLNTVILSPDGSYKDSVNHDVYTNALNWNNWADWVNSKAQTSDIVAVASFDAITNAPRLGGTAEALLNNIGAERAFSLVVSPPPPNVHPNRIPYALIFIKGSGISQEVVTGYGKPNTHLSILSYNLLTIQNQWRNAVLQNSWVRYSGDYNTAQYFKDSNGIVWLRGLIKSGTAGSTIFVLPEGYRPSNRQLHIAAAYDVTNIIGNGNNGVGRIDVLSDGRVVHVAGNNNWISLDSIAFRAAI